VASQIQLILSRDLARDIIEKLKLGERPEFDPVLRGPSLLRTLFGIMGVSRDPMTMTPEERVLKSFQDRLLAYQAEKSRVIVIEFDSDDPELAAKVAMRSRRNTWCCSAPPSRPRPARRGNGFPARSTSCAPRWRMPRLRSNVTAARPVSLSAPTI